MNKNVTDRILIKTIHDCYYQEFCTYDKSAPTRSSKTYVPIDCRAIAKKLDLGNRPVNPSVRAPQTA